MTTSTVGTTGPGMRVVLLADQNLVGQAVRTALGAMGFVVVHLRWPAAHHLEETAERVREGGAMVGLLICDLDKPGRVQEVVDLVAGTHLRWLLLSHGAEGPRWGSVLDAGVAAVLPISSGLDDLAVALHALARKRTVMDEVVRRRVLRQWRHTVMEQRALLARMDLLTTREMEVLVLLHDGSTVRGIAESSGVSETTVRSQVKAVLRKLEVSSQLAAVAAYRRAREMRADELHAGEAGTADPDADPPGGDAPTGGPPGTRVSSTMEQ
jgi:DNA-binding NarL/FixJ family response regulator